MNNQNIKIIPFFLCLLLTLSSCKSLDDYYNKGRRVHVRINTLELGMRKAEVIKAIQYQPDFVNKEAFSDGMREILVYRGTYKPNGWLDSPVPMVYHLVIENGLLVAIDSARDYEQIRINERRRYEEERKIAEKERTEALLEAQKEKNKKK